MADHTPTAWDLDVRSFVQTLSQSQPAYMAMEAVQRAIWMADAVQKVRNERGWKEGVAFLEGQALVREAERAKYGPGTPDKLPALLPIGTRILGATEVATSVVELQKIGGEPVYYGEWNGGTGYWPANEIDWEHVATSGSPLPVHPK